MPKIIIYDENGNINRAINLPYPGVALDVSAMSDSDFLALAQNLKLYKIDTIGTYPKLDANGLPIIIPR